MPYLEKGKISCCPGPILAGSTRIIGNIKGDNAISAALDFH